MSVGYIFAAEMATKDLSHSPHGLGARNEIHFSCALVASQLTVVRNKLRQLRRLKLA